MNFYLVYGFREFGVTIIAPLFRNNKNIDNLRTKTNTKIILLPSDEIVVSGLREDVAVAVAEINSIFKSRSERCTTIPAVVERNKHNLVIGFRGAGLNEILETTGVSVERPTDPDSDEFTLRGYPEDLGRALTMVYQLVAKSATEEITAAHRLHRLLIGKKGATLRELCEGYDAVSFHSRYYLIADGLLVFITFFLK